MIDAVKIRVDEQLKSTLQRLSDALGERPAWAEDVASASKLADLHAALAKLTKDAAPASAVAAVLQAVRALPTSTATPADLMPLAEAIGRLPAAAASPEAVAELVVAVEEAAAALARLDQAIVADASSSDELRRSVAVIADAVGRLPRSAASPAAVAGVLAAVRSLPRSAATPADLVPLSEAIGRLPREAASPQAVAELVDAVAEAVAVLGRLEHEAGASASRRDEIQENLAAVRAAIRALPQSAASPEAVAAVLNAVQSLPRSAATSADLVPLSSAIGELAEKVASPAAVAEVLAAVGSLPRSVATTAEVNAVRELVRKLPTPATPGAVEGVVTAIVAVASDIHCLQELAGSLVTAVEQNRNEVASLRTECIHQSEALRDIKQALEAVGIEQEAARLAHAEVVTALANIAGTIAQNQRALTTLNRPWYRRLFS